MSYTPEVRVVVDEMLTEVLRCQLNTNGQTRALINIVDELFEAFPSKVDLGLAQLMARQVMERSAFHFPSELREKAYAEITHPSTGEPKGMRHKVTTAFGQVALQQLGADLSNVSGSLAKAIIHSKQRTGNSEYRRFFKKVVNTFHKNGGVISETLIAAIGGLPKEIAASAVIADESTEDLNLDLDEPVEEAAPATDPSPVIVEKEEPSRPMEQMPLSEGILAKKEADDDLELDNFYIPTFSDFQTVFERYPFMKIVSYEGTAHLAIGYLSGRSTRDEGKLFRRNCAVKYWDEYGEDTDETHFTKLGGVCGVLEHREGETRRFIKVLPLKAGMAIRFWTNKKNEKDMPEMYRYAFIDDCMQKVVSKSEEKIKEQRSVLRQHHTDRGLLKKQAV